MKKTVKKNVIKKNVNNEVVNEFKNVVMNQIELLKLSESEDDQLTAVLYMLLHLYMIDDIISFRLANNIKDLHIENYDKDFSTLCDKLAKYMYNLSSIQEMNEDKLEFNRWLNSSLDGNGKTMRELTMNVVESTSDLIIIALFNLEISKKMQLYKGCERKVLQKNVCNLGWFISVGDDTIPVDYYNLTLKEQIAICKSLPEDDICYRITKIIDLNDIWGNGKSAKKSKKSC